MERLTRRLADFVVTHRALAVLIVLGATVGLATQLPKVRSDASPEKLIGSFAGFDASVGQEFRSRFGDTSRVLILLIEADDVLAPGPLGYQHRLTKAFRADDHVERIDSLTSAPIPRVVEQAPAEELGLDELEADEGGGLDELEAEGAGDSTPRLPPRLLNALVDLTSADPELFPGGVQALGERLTKNLRVSPIIVGEEVTAEQNAELIEALPQAPLLARRLYREDRKVAAVAMWLKPLDAREMRAFVESLRAHIEGNPAPEGTRVRIAGLPYLRNTIVEQIRTDQIVLIPLTVLFAAGILMLTLRWWFGVVMPLAVVACTALITVGGMGLVGEPMNVINNIIPTLLIMIGLSCAVHII
ncbi:MAG: MMPL family transporter, partial [Polyangiaceae bacterium]|nr:MMPL family transporter [Polyangiaceae bacterium]